MDYAPLRASADLPPLRVNLYSDTQTKPTPAMKEAMMRAEVGDEQFGLDPTVNALCDQMAALMGKEAAVFLPSGTMCNQVAILTHCRPGDEILAHETAHILTSEGGGAAALTGAQITGLRGPRGMFDAEALRAAIRPKTRYAPPQTLMEIEQTANTGGGAVWPVARMNELTAIAHENGMATHMDGARLMNAVVAAGTSLQEALAKVRRNNHATSAAAGFWWTEGGGDFPPMALASRGLLDPFSYATMLTGKLSVKTADVT
ncbi:MAG: threonine aldolase family protein, partial [Rhodospirillales bacterium]|nr:threonine aldolase family protein [Rhodospirillales bacterium]